MTFADFTRIPREFHLNSVRIPRPNGFHIDSIRIPCRITQGFRIDSTRNPRGFQADSNRISLRIPHRIQCGFTHRFPPGFHMDSRQISCEFHAEINAKRILSHGFMARRFFVTGIRRSALIRTGDRRRERKNEPRTRPGVGARRPRKEVQTNEYCRLDHIIQRPANADLSDNVHNIGKATRHDTGDIAMRVGFPLG